MLLMFFGVLSFVFHGFKPTKKPLIQHVRIEIFFLKRMYSGHGSCHLLGTYLGEIKKTTS